MNFYRTADAEEKKIEAFVKFNLFHHEQTDKFKAQINKIDNLFYNQKQNCFYCPMGQKMTQIGTFTKKTDNQFQQTITKYQAQNCEGCPLRGACHKQAGNRIIEVNMNLRLHKQKIREKLNSEEGIKHRKQRPQDVEATFGQIKSNHNFKRLRLKGLVKVEIEVGLACLAHNIIYFKCLNFPNLELDRLDGPLCPSIDSSSSSFLI